MIVHIEDVLTLKFKENMKIEPTPKEKPMLIVTVGATDLTLTRGSCRLVRDYQKSGHGHVSSCKTVQTPCNRPNVQEILIKVHNGFVKSNVSVACACE